MQNITDEIVAVVSQLEPQQIFEQDTLKQWVQENCAPGDVYTDKELIEWVQDHNKVVIANLRPEDIFDRSQLEEWAEDNNYIREE